MDTGISSMRSMDAPLAMESIYFMESVLSLVRTQSDHEPTPSPSKEGSRTAWPGPLPGGVRGGFVADGTDRFIERPSALTI